MNLQSFIYVGDFYKKFLETKMKSYNYIKGQDGFNMAMCRIKKNKCLFSIRILSPIESYFGEEIIPGNYSNMSLEYIQQLLKKRKEEDPKYNTDVKIGKNFMWNNWMNVLIDNTIFFVGKIENDSIIIDKKIMPVVIYNKKISTKEEHKKNFMYSDVRIFKKNKTIYIYDGMISSIYTVEIKNNNIHLSYNNTFGKKMYSKNLLCSVNENYTNQYVNKYDKNWSFVDIINDKEFGKSFEFLNWYDRDSSCVTSTIVQINGYKCRKDIFIKMKKDIIPVYGNEYLPMFSFGTPFVRFKINNKKKNKGIIYDGISVGHTKIRITKEYTEGNLNKFISLVRDKYKNYSYIEHNSYMYLIYFIRLKKYKNGKKIMKISDSFLYTNNHNKKYKFSIQYPMGIILLNNFIYVSCGEGDYYNFLLKFKSKDIKKVCTHNVHTFNEKTYECHLI